MNRKAMKSRMVPASRQPAVASMNSPSAVSSSGRRPYLSLTVPKNSCPAARPIVLAVRLNCTIDEEAPKNSVSTGNAGRYMSMTKGPKALSMPR